MHFRAFSTKLTDEIIEVFMVLTKGLNSDSHYFRLKLIFLHPDLYEF